jgi:hypothetical protein
VARKKKINKYPAGFRKLALERMKTCRNVSELSAELGIHRTQAVQVATGIGSRRRWDRSTCELARAGTTKGNPRAQARAGRESAGSGFFQRCLAKGRGSTPEQRRLWRDGVFEEIRELMTVQGNLGVDRMCQLAQASRASFYRSLKEQAPEEGDLEVRSPSQTKTYKLAETRRQAC